MILPALTTSGLTLSYPGLTVIDGLDLSLPTGQVTALVGPNGSGKSTLLRALARLHRPDRGAIHLGQDPQEPVDIAALPTRELARRVAMLSQDRPRLGGVTVREVVGYGRHPHRGRLLGADPAGAQAVHRAMTLTRVDGLAARGIDELSGGQVQRVWLAACLAQDPRLLLLDEPTNHLDLRHQVELLELVRELADQHQVTVAVVLHDLNHAAQVADQVALLVSGQIIASGHPRDVLTADELTRAYGVPVTVHHDADGPVITARPTRRPARRAA